MAALQNLKEGKAAGPDKIFTDLFSDSFTILGLWVLGLDFPFQ